ncbi:MAG: hypothetical protein IJ206_03835 [Oscillospiraceae bacterium]|nr:hypothetical protein [Oscillospiraceae bacterium]
MDGDGRMIHLEKNLYGRPIRVTAHRLDEGIHVLIIGGDRTHVGAVSWAEPGLPPETKLFPGHKDHYITEKWAGKLAQTVGARAVVACGIHYDGAEPEQIREILRTAEALLEELCREI